MIVAARERRGTVTRWAFGVAAVVGVSLVMSHAHFLTDVLGGMAIAGAIGLPGLALARGGRPRA